MTVETIRALHVMLADPAEDYYGLKLADAAEMPTGSIYPILARLEKEGWVESRWEQLDPSEAGRPPRRLYRLTAHGAARAPAAIKKAVGPQPVVQGGLA